MDPIDTLKNEHGLIRRFVDTLSTAVTRLEVGQVPPRAFFDNCIEFVTGFSDGFHHRKEELVMFVRLAQRKNGAIDGQVEALRYQHDQGRRLIAAIAGALDKYEEGEPNGKTTVLENAAAFASLLRHHIHTEDHEFFPMARDVMTDEDLEELGREFDDENERQGTDTFDRFHNLVIALEAMLADR